MKNSMVMAILLSICSLSACVESNLVVGRPGPAIKSEDVVVYYIDRPPCNFETIAHISMNGGYYTLELLVAGMQKQAASVGATGLYVLQTQQLEIKEYLGTAKAIRCLPT